MWRDLRYAFRQLGGKKLLAFTVILLLALGIGANTAVFSFVNSLLLRPLPVREPQNLYLLQKNRVRQVRPDTSLFYRQFEAVNQAKSIVTAAVAEQAWANNSFQVFSSGDTARVIATQIVSPNYFSELGVSAVAGRVLTAADANESANIPAVLSYQFWNSQFHRSLDILNHIIRVKNYPFVAVGVLPREFHGVEADRVPDVRFPISAARVFTGAPITEVAGGQQMIRFQILARLAPGVSSSRAAAAVFPALEQMEEPLWRDWYAHSPQQGTPAQLQSYIDWERSYRIALRPASRGISELRDHFSRAVLLLMGAVALLLLGVCANVAGLLLARSEERKSEIAIRLSVGATRWALLRQLAVECALLTVPGAILGVALAYAFCPWLLKFLPPGGIGPYAPPVVLDARPDAPVLLFVLGLSALTTILFGIAPARHAWKLDLNDQLKAHNRQSSARSGVVTVAIQVALGVVLLTTATLMCRTFWNLEHLNPGFDRAHVIEFTIDPWNAGYADAQAGTLLFNLKDKVSRLPGVRAVSLAGSGLMEGIAPKTTVVPAGSTLPAKTFLNTNVNWVTSGYFESLGIPLLAGRVFEPGDAGRSPAPIVVNRAFAQTFFPHTNPIGKAIVQGVDGNKPPVAVIVGVVGTAKYRSMRELDPPIYYTATDDRHAGGTMYVRVYGDPAGFIKRVRAVLRRLAPNLPFAQAFTLEQEVQNSLWQERLVTLLCAFFGLAALALSAIGLYANLAYSVARRSKELGIRIALGAQVRDILRTVSAQLLFAVGLGLLLGSALAVFLLRFTRTLVFGVDPFDPASFAGAAAILLLCSILAATPASWRAVKTDVNSALRQE
ncbi:MAG TPA: ABC transporter permease [Bryobacteraceae bacterium]|nr:ABC transporter permease [Bryobacteraceae bacterium]